MKLLWDWRVINKSTITITHNPVQHDQTKLLEIDWYFIKEKLDNCLISYNHQVHPFKTPISRYVH